MFKDNLGTLDLSGKSGRKYTFKMCQYDTMESIDKAVNNYSYAGLYVFAKKYRIPNDVRNWYTIKYIGETEDYSKRDYGNHHKKGEIETENANSWGYCTLFVSDKERKEIEADLIANYNPPCND